MSFIDKKVAEVIAAREAGNPQAAANAIKEALLEDDGDLTTTLQRMNESAARQTR